MLSLTTPQTVQNITRVKATSCSIKEAYLVIELQFRPPAGGQDEATQAGRAYCGTQTITVRNAPDMTDTVAFSTDATVNPYTALLVREQAAIASALDHAVAAISGHSTTTSMLAALEASLATDGIIPPGT